MRSRAAFVCVIAALLPLAACGGYGRPNLASSQLAFGVDMARRGLWDEALFRFEEAARLDPGNPRIQSNLGVAFEAAGKFDEALAHYQQALKQSPNDKEIRANYARFVEFYQGFKGEKTAAGSGDKAGAAKNPTPNQKPPALPTPGEPSTPEDAPPPPADVPPPV